MWHLALYLPGGFVVFDDGCLSLGREVERKVVGLEKIDVRYETGRKYYSGQFELAESRPKVKN